MKPLSRLGVTVLYGLVTSTTWAQPPVPCQLPSETSQPEQTDALQSFEGTIVKTKTRVSFLKAGATFLLMDYLHKTAYILDDKDQEKVKPYEGKKVTITGSLDPLTNTISVSAIRASG